MNPGLILTSQVDQICEWVRNEGMWEMKKSVKLNRALLIIRQKKVEMESHNILLGNITEIFTLRTKNFTR